MLPVRAVPRGLCGGSLADGGARVDHVDRRGRGARALGPRGAARARRRRRAAVVVSHPPPGGEGRD